MLLFSCEVSLDIFVFGGEVWRKAGSLAPRLVLVGWGGRQGRRMRGDVKTGIVVAAFLV